MLTWVRSRFQACEMSHAGPFFCLNMSFQEMVAANPKLLLGDVSNAISIHFPNLCISSLFWILCFPIGFPMGSRWYPGYPFQPPRLRMAASPSYQMWPVTCGSACGFNDHSRSHQQNIWKPKKKHQSHYRSHHHTVMIVISDVVMVLVCFSNRSDIIPRGCSCWFSTPFGRVFGLWVANKWHF